jgi:hypothetical protein
MKAATDDKSRGTKNKINKSEVTAGRKRNDARTGSNNRGTGKNVTRAEKTEKSEENSSMDQEEKHGNSEEAQNKKGRRKNGEITPQNDCAKKISNIARRGRTLKLRKFRDSSR